MGLGTRRCIICNNWFEYEIKKSRPPDVCSDVCSKARKKKNNQARKVKRAPRLDVVRSYEEMRRTGLTHSERQTLKFLRSAIQRPKETMFRRMETSESRRLPDKPVNPCIDEE